VPVATLTTAYLLAILNSFGHPRLGHTLIVLAMMILSFVPWTIHIKRDTQPSIAYSEELIFSMSVTLQSTDRHHGIVG
jgi:hypothetical protein